MTTFDLQSQHDHVMRHGDYVQWCRASKCPCAPSGDANRANPNCKVCFGIGFRYAAPATLVGMVHGINNEKSLLESGIAFPGDMVLSLSPLEQNVISDFDLIQVTWGQGQPYDGDVIKRGTGATDKLTYAAAQVFEVFSVDGTLTTITAYDENTSWTVEGRDITWIGGQPQPAAGQMYSVKYAVASWDWIAFVSPMQRFETGTNLGLKVLLRKRHLAFKKS